MLPTAALLLLLAGAATGSPPEEQQRRQQQQQDPLELADALEQAGRLEDAASAYRAAIEGPYANEPAAHGGLGGVLSQLGICF